MVFMKITHLYILIIQDVESNFKGQLHTRGNILQTSSAIKKPPLRIKLPISKYSFFTREYFIFVFCRVLVLYPTGNVSQRGRTPQHFDKICRPWSGRWKLCISLDTYQLNNGEF